MRFSPRLVQLLYLLVHSEEPIQVDDLAEQMKISKRTVYREIVDGNRSLSSYNLKLTNKTRKGLLIEGDHRDVERLRRDLEHSDTFDPRNRDERQMKLVQALLKEEDAQKIYFYSDALQVSEATISNDLASVEPQLKKHGLNLVKRSGYGIKLEYEEQDYRNFVLSIIKQHPESALLDQRIVDRVREILEDYQKGILDRLTCSSNRSLEIILALSIMRIKANHPVVNPYDLETLKGAREYGSVVENICSELSKTFDMVISAEEKDFITVFLLGSKHQYHSRETALIYDDQKIKRIVYEMVDIYAPEIATELKCDDSLIDGLITHLEPTITRLLHNIPINNPLLDHIRENYSDYYRKAGEASHIITKHTGCDVPEEEIGYIAMHFGSAIIRLKEKKKIRRVVDIGVVCSSGIGVSNLLASKILQNFGDKVTVSTMTKTTIDEHIKNAFDFMVSTFELSIKNVPVLRVSPFLSEEQLQHIARMIEAFAFQAERWSPEQSINQSVKEILSSAREVESIMKDFKVASLPKQISFSHTIDFVGEIMGKDVLESKRIIEGLHQREALSTQVISELKLTLLHAQIEGLSDSKLMLIKPEGEIFEDAYFQGTKLIIVVLIPMSAQSQTPMISEFTWKLFESDELLDELMNQSSERIIELIEGTLNVAFQNRVKSILE